MAIWFTLPNRDVAIRSPDQTEMWHNGHLTKQRRGDMTLQVGPIADPPLDSYMQRTCEAEGLLRTSTRLTLYLSPPH